MLDRQFISWRLPKFDLIVSLQDVSTYQPLFHPRYQRSKTTRMKAGRRSRNFDIARLGYIVARQAVRPITGASCRKLRDRRGIGSADRKLKLSAVLFDILRHGNYVHHVSSVSHRAGRSRSTEVVHLQARTSRRPLPQPSHLRHPPHTSCWARRPS